MNSSTSSSEASARILPLANRGLGLALLLFGLFWMLWTLSNWYRLHLHLPWRDTFVVLSSIIPLLENGTGLDHLATWFEPHYAAHRIALPRALIAADLAWLNGQNHLIYTAGWLALLGSLALVLIPGWRDLRESTSARILLLAVALCFMLGPSQLWNILNPINISWHLSYVFSALAFWCVLRRGADIHGKDMLLAWICAVLAAFSSFGGLLACLLLPIAALRGPRAYLPANLLFALGFTIWYLQGIASDATVAANWSGGNEKLIEQMRQSAEAAMAANTIPQVAWKALGLLSWPRSQTWPLLAPLLTLAAMLVLPLAGLRWIRSLRDGERSCSRWQSLCLMLAILSLGIALSTQLGRMMEQPNYAHGPSFERYQTIVAFFWLCTLALWISFCCRDPLRLLAAGVASVVITLVMIVPGGDYLKQEIDSNHYAARLYAQGEIEALRPKLEKRGLRFRPEFLFSFDEFFRRHSLAYRVSAPLAPVAETLPGCETLDLDLHLSPGESPDLLELQLRLPAGQFLITRELWLASPDRLLARLYPKHLGDYRPLPLIRTELNPWTGSVITSGIAAKRPTLMARSVLGTRALCSIDLHLAP